MDVLKSNYLKQHIWNIIQCVIGFGCLALEWLAYSNPRAIQSNAAPAASTGLAMTPQHVMPWYLWVGITALVLSVIIPATIRMIRNWRPVPPKSGLTINLARWGPRQEDVKNVTKRVRNSFDKSGEVEVSTNVLRDPFKGETKRLWVTYSITKTVEVSEEHPSPRRLTLRSLESPEKLFNSLQLDAFQLAKSLHEFLLEEMPSFPGEIDPKREPLNVVHQHSDDRIAWRKRVEAKYERRFSRDVDDLILKFREVDIPFPLSFAPRSSVKKIEDDIPRVIMAITAMAHRIDGIVFYGREQ